MRSLKVLFSTLVSSALVALAAPSGNSSFCGFVPSPAALAAAKRDVLTPSASQNTSSALAATVQIAWHVIRKDNSKFASSSSNVTAS